MECSTELVFAKDRKSPALYLFSSRQEREGSPTIVRPDDAGSTASAARFTERVNVHFASWSAGEAVNAMGALPFSATSRHGRVDEKPILEERFQSGHSLGFAALHDTRRSGFDVRVVLR